MKGRFWLEDCLMPAARFAPEHKGLARLALALGLSGLMSLVACSTLPSVRVTIEPQGYSAKVPASVLDEPDQVSAESASVLETLGLSSRAQLAAKIEWLGRWKNPESVNPAQRLALAELATQVGLELGETPEAAILHYLQVCLFTQDDVLERGGMTLSSQRDVLARALYNHACGQLAAGVRFLRQPESNAVLREEVSSRWRIPSGYFDWLQAVDHLDLGEDRPRVSNPGVGGALLGYRLSTRDRLEANRYMTPPGFCVPLNAVVRVRRSSAGGFEVDLRWNDLMEEESMMLDGKRLPLAGDFAIVYPEILSRAPRSRGTPLGLERMVRSDEFIKDMGLYCNGPIRMNKIPVVFVHGLMSHPETWKNMWMDLIQDPLLRERYQFWAFMYPSGLPLIFSSSGLTKELNALVRAYEEEGKGALAHEMVLIGHSMGGLLSSIQIRLSDEALYDRLFRVSPDALEVDEFSREAVKERFFGREADYVRRAIFISTPHRGSSIADSAVGRLGSSLIQLPKSMLTLDGSTVAQATTDLGFTLFKTPGNAIEHLREDNPTLGMILQQPVLSGITYHSIIGDRGIRVVDVEKRSDGVVSYTSAHLDGAASEKVVPSGHGATQHPEAIAEVRRILTLHLE